MRQPTALFGVGSLITLPTTRANFALYTMRNRGSHIVIAVRSIMMPEINSSEALNGPAAFWQTGDLLHQALDKVYDAANEEIEDVLEQALSLAGNDRSASISSWSLRISSWGLEIVTAPIEDWIGERELSTRCYLHNFVAGNTLEWLISVAEQHRDALKRALVEYAVRSVGYETSYPSKNAFVDALEDSSLASRAIVTNASDEIPW